MTGLSINFQCLTVCILLTFIPANTAIMCYKCASDKDSSCTDKKASSPAIPASNCSNPNELVEKWIGSHGLKDIGIGSVNLEDSLHLAKAGVENSANLKYVTACAYFFASTENKVTAGFDDAVSKTRSFFGDKKADESITIKKWVMRDCVTLKFDEKTSDDQGNRCVPVGGLKHVAKIHLCICNKDQCNENGNALKHLIGEAEKNKGNIQHANWITALLIQILSMILVIS